MNFNFSDLFWVILFIISVQPAWQRQTTELRRVQAIKEFEKQRSSRAILLIHRQESISLLGIPISRFISIEDSEQVLRAIRLTPPDVPIELGLFPANFLHNAVHIVVGVLGIAAATSLSGSIVFNRGFAIAYTPIALMGLIHATNTVFGLMPIYGNNVWFNALTALLAGYFGFFKVSEAKEADLLPSL